MGNKCLITYSSYSGNTEKVALRFKETFEKQGLPLPRNEPSHGTDRDLVRRNLDCAMINWAIPMIEKELKVHFQTVRGVGYRFSRKG